MSSILLPISPSAAVTANISGQTVILGSGTSAISGVVGANVSGGVVVSGGLQISGSVVVSGSVSISGSVAYLSPTTQSGNNYVLEVGSAVIFPTGSGAGLGSFASGGMTLASSGPLVSLTIRSQSGNGVMNIGGAAGTSGTAATAVGIELFANESMTLKVNNSNLVSIWNGLAASSGQKVTMVGLKQI